jgi:protein phosphatase
MKSFAITDIGLKRDVNQDFYYVSDKTVGAFPNFYIVADGMGGHKAGDYAAKLCVSEFVQRLGMSVAKTPIAMIEESLNAANDEVYRVSESNVDYSGMGTTFVCATIANRVLTVANVGDSRAYLYHAGGLEQISFDHSFVAEMMRRGELTAAEARIHPQKNMITRAVGDSKRLDIDYFEVDLVAGDIVLLCSDGLCGLVDDEAMLQIFAGYKQDLPLLGRQLVEQALAEGGSDNVTVVLAECEGTVPRLD